MLAPLRTGQTAVAALCRGGALPVLLGEVARMPKEPLAALGAMLSRGLALAVGDAPRCVAPATMREGS